MLAGAGAVVGRDQIDARIVEEVKSGKGVVVDDPRDRGGRVSPLLRSPLTDTDSDVMLDAWENVRGLNALTPLTQTATMTETPIRMSKTI